MEISELLDQGACALAGAGIEDHKTEAVLLLEEALKKPYIEILTGRSALTAAQEVCYNNYIEKRKTRYPYQYITGKVDFMGIGLNVDERALIPRPETELLAACVIGACHSPNYIYNIADMGTGSGNIAISLTKHITHCIIWAFDISDDALELAKANAEMNSAAGRIRFALRDIRDGLPADTEGTFDIIVSNPPYVRRSELDFLQEEVRFEKRIFLDGGEDGLDYYRYIVVACRRGLKTGGKLFFEVGYDQAEAVSGIISGSGIFGREERFKDYNGRERVVTAERIIKK